MGWLRFKNTATEEGNVQNDKYDKEGSKHREKAS